MTKKDYIYCRVSTKEQDYSGNGLQGQENDCRRYGASLGLPDYNPVVVSEDASGSMLFSERPKGGKLHAAVMRGQVRSVIMWNAKRIARDLYEGIGVLRDWLGVDGQREDGPQVYTINGGRITNPSDLATVIHLWEAQSEWEDIRRRTMMGRRTAIDGGRVVASGLAPFGYRFEGKKKDTRLVVVEEEAVIVREIYHLFVHGNGDGIPLGVQAIADELTRRRVPSRADTTERKRKPEKEQGPAIRKKAGVGGWTARMVYPILERETYAGTWYGYRYAMKRKEGQKSRKNERRERRPRSEWVGVPCPAIIDAKTFKAAHYKLEVGRNRARENGETKNKYLLSGRLKCTCGYFIQGKPTTVHGRVYLYYRCNGCERRNAGGECRLPNLKVETWDGIVWGWLEDAIRHPDRLMRGMKAEQESKRKENAPMMQRLAKVEARLEELEREIDRAADLFISGLLDKDAVKLKKELREKEREGCLRERAELIEYLEANVLTDEQVETFEQFCATMAKGLDNVTWRDKRDFLEWVKFGGKVENEEGKPVMYARAVFGEKRLQPDTATPSRCRSRKYVQGQSSTATPVQQSGRARIAGQDSPVPARHSISRPAHSDRPR